MDVVAYATKKTLAAAFLIPQQIESALSQWLRRHLYGFGIGYDAAGAWHIRSYLAIEMPAWVQAALDHFPAWASAQALAGVYPVITGRFRSLGGGSATSTGASLALGAAIGMDVLDETGTLGAFVEGVGGPFILSCRHILDIGIPVAKHQPDVSEIHNGLPLRRIGTALEISHFTSGAIAPHHQPNHGDWGLSSIAPGIIPNPGLPGDLGTLAQSHGAVAKDMPVRKAGRSPLSAGTVFDISADVKVDYPQEGTLFFSDQILIRGDGGVPFAGPGDSGALVVDGSTPRKGIAMVFAAGDPPASTAGVVPVEHLTAAMPLGPLFTDRNFRFII